MKKALLVLSVALAGAVTYANASSIPACRPGSPNCPCQMSNMPCPPDAAMAPVAPQ